MPESPPRANRPIKTKNEKIDKNVYNNSNIITQLNHNKFSGYKNNCHISASKHHIHDILVSIPTGTHAPITYMFGDCFSIIT